MSLAPVTVAEVIELNPLNVAAEAGAAGAGGVTEGVADVGAPNWKPTVSFFVVLAGRVAGKVVVAAEEEGAETVLEDAEKGFDARGGTAAGPVKNPPKDAEAGGITRLGAAAAAADTADAGTAAGTELVPPKVNPVVAGGVIENPVAPPVEEAAAGAPKLNPPGSGVAVDTAVCALEGCIENDPEKSFVGPEGGAVPQGVDVGIGTSAVTVAVFEATGAEPKEKAGMVTGAL